MGGRGRTLALVAVALVSLPRLAFAEEEEAARRWKADGAVSYMTSEQFSGVGFTVGMLRTAGPYFAGGISADLTYGGASGTTVYMTPIGDVGGPYSFKFLSWLLAGVGQLRVPIESVTPYLEVRIGVGGAELIEHENTQCGYGTGLVVGGGGGIDVAFSSTISAGVRGSARTIAGNASCTDLGGPASFDTVVLFSLGASFDYHW